MIVEGILMLHMLMGVGGFPRWTGGWVSVGLTENICVLHMGMDG